VLLASPLPEPEENEWPAYKWELTPDGLGYKHLVDLDPLDYVEPNFVPETDVLLLHFSHLNPTTGVRLFMTLESLQNSNLNGAWPTRFTIHGWTSSQHDPLNIRTRAAYLSHGNYNMITVDWNAGAATPNYVAARNAVGPTGVFVGRFIEFCVNHGYMQYENVHVIGHSLGGHAAGHAGKIFNPPRIHCIMSLDPAGPLFFETSTDRVATTDGIFVETIITNGGVLGFMGSLGHANWFPNHGRTQPGCTGSGCDHSRAVEFLIESIDHSRPFFGRECPWDNISAGTCPPGQNTAARMGGRDPFDITLRGNYFLTTNPSSPFSQG